MDTVACVLDGHNDTVRWLMLNHTWFQQVLIRAEDDICSSQLLNVSTDPMSDGGASPTILRLAK
jgi:hypothetical protein